MTKGKGIMNPGPKNNVLLLEWEMHHEVMSSDSKQDLR